MKIAGSGSVRGMDPRVQTWIHTKMSWITKTVRNAEFFKFSLMSYTFFGLVDQGEVCQRPTTNAINIEDLIRAGGVSVASKYNYMT